eukprot:14740602-Heterocapsa_arctica.AAC.1
MARTVRRGAGISSSVPGPGVLVARRGSRASGISPRFAWSNEVFGIPLVGGWMGEVQRGMERDHHEAAFHRDVCDSKIKQGHGVGREDPAFH